MGDQSQHPIEILRRVPVEPPPASPNVVDGFRSPTSWWSQYSEAIQRLPNDTRLILEDDARYIAQNAVPQVSGDIDKASYGINRVRTGLVLGSVQSGKTASMLAVGALLLDSGIDILVILAGTRVALWLQTYERLLSQLDGSNIHSAWKRNQKRVLVPQPEDILASAERVDSYRYLNGPRRKVRTALNSGLPTIFVIPKEDDHLLALARFLTEETGPDVVARRGRQLTMVVLDDEADDASILDARDGLRLTPQFIQYLWSSDECAPSTRHNALYTTYIAYTATAQANYLQDSHNPLAPRSFHAALRVPSDRGEREPRTATYFERAGLPAFYCGGEIFYERLRNLPGDLCLPTEFPQSIYGEDELDFEARLSDVRWGMIGDAVRAYFVSGAVRLLLQGKRLTNVPSKPVSREALERSMPAPHSMLYHPSALKEVHFLGAQDLVRWSRGLPGSERNVELPRDDYGQPILALDPDGLRRRLELEEPEWRHWLSQFTATERGLASLPGGAFTPLPPNSWNEIKSLLIDEVFPNTCLRVLNSDPRADDRPQFEPVAVDSAGTLWNAPRDVYTIFVAGNVLSRGLTVEGLCTSLFLRGSREPAADTQMQMQRWFGYRGRHLAFCRVFLFDDQLELFRQYHFNDVAMRTEVLNHMDGHTAPFHDGVLVLQGARFRATAKVDSRKVPLHPGGTPAIRLVEPSHSYLYENNLEVLDNILKDGSWEFLDYPTHMERGLIRTEPVSMLDVADLLERLRYSVHDPDLGLDLSQRWTSLQRTLNLSEPLFRPPGHSPGPMAVDPSGCPYTVAAYLRLWKVALSRHDLSGMQPTDDPNMPWSMVNLEAYRATEPRFYVGIRFGSEGPTSRLNYRQRHFPMMRRALAPGRSYLLETLWGSRNPSERWYGDQAFDYHFHAPAQAPRLLDDGAWRRRGQPGLVLFHFVPDPQSGREMVALGIALPHGGPDHVAALRTSGRSRA